MEFLTYILKSGGILTLFYVVYLLVLRRDTFFIANRTYLLTGIVSALVLPFVTFTTVTIVAAPSIVENTSFTEITPIVATNTVVETNPIAIWQIILLVYGIGFTIMLLRFCLQLFSLLRVLRKYPSKRLDRYRIVEIADTVAPFSFFNYIVYNPETHDANELQMILKHEKVHAAQWHSIDLLLANLIRVFQWANPISWFYKSSVEANLEFLADNETAQHLPSKTEYQLALLKASSSLPVPALTNNFYHSFIKKRIIMLNKNHSNKYNKLKLSIVLPALALFLWSFNTVEVFEYVTPVSEAAATTPPNTENEPFFLGFSTNSTNAQLDALETYFSDEHPESLIKIDNRKRNSKGELTNFSFKTKFEGNDRYYKRFDRGEGGAPFQTVYEIAPQETGTLLVSEIGKDGMQFKITKDRMEMFVNEDKALNLDTKSVQPKSTTQKQKPLLGDNPLYIINGKNYRKDELPAEKTIELDGAIEVLNKEEGKERYGDKGKDGVLFFNGVATFTSEKAEVSEPAIVKEPMNKPKKTANTSPAKISEEEKTASFPVKEIRIKITKNTTKEQLDTFKKELKRDHDIDFNYKNVDFNENNEISAIKVSYKGKGMSGSYSVTDDDGEGIDDFYFYMDTDEGRSGFGSGAMKKRSEIRDKILAERKELRNSIRENRTENLADRREEIEEMREKLTDERQEMRQEVTELRKNQKQIIKEERKLARGYAKVAGRTKLRGGSKITINKDTTNEELALLKEKMESKGFSFNYSRLKRNANGEITRIKIESDNKKGSKQTITTNTHGSDPIDPIAIQQ